MLHYVHQLTFLLATHPVQRKNSDGSVDSPDRLNTVCEEKDIFIPKFKENCLFEI